MEIVKSEKLKKDTAKVYMVQIFEIGQMNLKLFIGEIGLFPGDFKKTHNNMVQCPMDMDQLNEFARKNRLRVANDDDGYLLIKNGESYGRVLKNTTLNLL